MASSELFTWDFWQRAITQATHSAACSALTPLATQELDFLSSVPWYAVASAAGIGALISLVLSITSIRVPGTAPASFLPSRSGPDTTIGS